jgi:hypothetical protein
MEKLTSKYFDHVRQILQDIFDKNATFSLHRLGFGREPGK